MALGSWLRFVLGILLALEVIRGQFFSGGTSIIALVLAVVLLILSAAYFLFKF
jgi:hypothetical protein